jgi:hypothetical protein
MKLLFETFKEIGKEFYIKKKDQWINYNPLKKTIVYVVDHDSHRSASMARELRKKRWKIILIYLGDIAEEYLIKQYVDIEYIHNCESIEECLDSYKQYAGTPIHVFSHSSSPLTLNFIKTYPRFSIYDPKEITYGVIRFINFRDFLDNSLRQKVRALLVAAQQRIILKYAHNIICRDMQLSNSRVMKLKQRKNKNIILFSDYIEFNCQKKQKNDYNHKIKLVTCGNLNVYDYKRSKAAFTVFEHFLKKGHEVHIYGTVLYKNQTIDQLDHPELNKLKKKYPLLQVFKTVTQKQLHTELNKCDYGLFVPGEHFFNRYGNFNSFWRPELIYLSSAARVTSYIESGLITIGVETKPNNYPFFLAKRYGKVLSINHKKLHKLDDLKHKYEYPENNKNQNYFKLENNIPRLENFYKKIFDNINSISLKK